MTFYDKRAWRDHARKAALIKAGFACAKCGTSLAGKGKLAQVHHVHAVKESPSLALEPRNHRPLCARCHRDEETRIRQVDRRGSRVRPVLKRPSCRVVLVCGPPGAGKSTYARDHAGPNDQIIDLDEISREHGFGPYPPRRAIGALLDARNTRLRALHRAPRKQTAWVVLTAASEKLRTWWATMLAVRPGDLIVLKPSLEELKQRILADPERRWVAEYQLAAVDRWFANERGDDPGYIRSGCGVDGMPLDPLHPWAASQCNKWQQPRGAGE